MLTRIHIRDLAIVSSLELEFSSGMTVLTGETGAGKSILIDALGLTLGERAEAGMIREGCERAEITAVFDIAQRPGVAEWFAEQALDAPEGECILRRVLVRSGSSRSFVNGSPIPARQLAELGERLVEIHSQHAHQALLQRDHQRNLLDGYAAERDLVERTARLHRTWQESARKLEELRTASRERGERLDLLRFQSGELEGLRLQAGEIAELDEEHGRLSNAGRLQAGCAGLLNLLYDADGSIQEQLAGAMRELESLGEIDHRLGESREVLEGAVIQVEEAARALRSYAEHMELDPQRLAEVEQRLSELHDMGRKYRCRPAELPERLEQLRTELERLEHADIHLANLERETGALRGEFLRAAEQLEQVRRAAAERLGREVTEGMQGLGMKGGRLAIEVERLPEERASQYGLNRVEFLVAANPGQSLQPMAKVASGGELSRISLAIQVSTARCTGTPTLIFDEVDVGIGGGVAEIVGRLLRRLGDDRQVLCVTHLPQVASQGHNQLRVSKQSGDGGTLTSIAVLDPAQRVEEIARMLGGVAMTEQTLAHAREMLKQASAG